MTLLPACRIHVLSYSVTCVCQDCPNAITSFCTAEGPLTLASLIAMPLPMPCEPPATTASFEVRLRPELRLRAQEDILTWLVLEQQRLAPQYKAK